MQATAPAPTIDAAWVRRFKKIVTHAIDYTAATLKIPGGVGVHVRTDRYTGTKDANAVLSSSGTQLLEGFRRTLVEIHGLGWVSTKWLSRLYTLHNGVDEWIWIHDGQAKGGEGHGLYEAWAGNHTLRHFLAENIPSQILQITARTAHLPQGSPAGSKVWVESLWPQLFEEQGDQLVEDFNCDGWGWGSKASFALSFFGTQTVDPANYPVGPHGAGVTWRNGRMKNDARKLGGDAGAGLVQRRPYHVIDHVRFEVENTGPTNSRPLILGEGTKRYSYKDAHFRSSRVELDGAVPGGIELERCDGGALLVIGGKKHKTFDALQQPFQA
ncbi:MAG: hypothetical protein K8S98_16575 [Planctomycetes bacterium]|nr:hypothetical protein [Planctomycetota bacterium]